MHPLHSEEDFPLLTQQPNQKQKLDQQICVYKRFLVFKNKNSTDTQLGQMDPWEMNQALKTTFGNKTLLKITRLRSGNLLIMR